MAKLDSFAKLHGNEYGYPIIVRIQPLLYYLDMFLS